MISFSSNLKEKYSKNSDIIIQIINKWCDGKSIEILDEVPKKTKEYTSLEHNFGYNINVWILKNDVTKIDGGFISLVENKYIFSHKDQILTRCGCGKSFSFKTWNDMQDKIQILRKKLKKQKECK